MESNGMKNKTTVNKKIKNATPLVYDGITFKSKLEVMAYKTLKAEGFPVMYEPVKFVIWQGFKPTVPFYDKDKITHLLKENNKKLIDISYTPDFMFGYKGKNIILELKGLENDVYPLKKKLFRAYLEKNCSNSIYFEIFSKKQLLQAIEIIKSL